MDCFLRFICFDFISLLELGFLVLILLLSLALSLTLPLASLKLSLYDLLSRRITLLLILNIRILFIASFNLNIALIVNAAVDDIVLSLAYSARSGLTSLLLAHNNNTTIFNKFGSATRHLGRARIHFVLLFYLFFDLRTIPILLLIFGNIRGLGNVVTSTNLRFDLLY